MVVMAGGEGARLWPASRRRRPKQFLDLFGGGTLLRMTLERLSELVPPERILVVGNALHRELLEAQLPGGVRAIYEPVGRGTAPCLGLAALHLLAWGNDGVAVAIPADNWLGPGPGFARAVKTAADQAGRGRLALIGTTAKGPAPGFGYIKPGPPWPGAPGDPPVHPLEAFEEKPSPERAASLCAEGWLWNAGIFAFRPSELLAEVERLQPALHRALTRLRSAWGTPGYAVALAEEWPRLPVVSMDEGIAARGPRRAAVVRGDFDWSDLGTWDAVRRAALAADAPNAVNGDAHVWAGRGCLVRAEGGRFVAVIGADDLVVVDTPDALLVLGPGRGQEVRGVVGSLAGRREELL